MNNRLALLFATFMVFGFVFIGLRVEAHEDSDHTTAVHDGPYWSPLREQFEEQYIHIQNDDERIDFLKQTESQALMLSRGSDSNVAKLGLFLAHEYRNVGLEADSQRIFRNLAKLSNSDDFVAVDSLRMLAQYELFVQNKPDEALKRFDKIELVIDSSDNPWVRHTVDMLSMKSRAQEKMQQYEQAIATQRKLKEGYESQIPKMAAFGNDLSIARNLRRVGDVDGSYTAYNDIFDNYPEQGTSDGSVVNFYIEQAIGFDSNWNDAQHADALLSIWENPVLSDYPQVYIVGNNIADGLHESGRIAELIAFMGPYLNRLDQYLDDHDDEVVKKHSLENIHQKALLMFAQALLEEPFLDTAKSGQLLDKFFSMYPHSELSEIAWSLRARHKNLETRASEELGLVLEEDYGGQPAIASGAIDSGSTDRISKLNGSGANQVATGFDSNVGVNNKSISIGSMGFYLSAVFVIGLGASGTVYFIRKLRST